MSHITSSRLHTMRIDARVTLIFTVEQRGVREGNYVMQLYFLTGTLQETAALTLKAVKNGVRVK